MFWVGDLRMTRGCIPEHGNCILERSLTGRGPCTDSRGEGQRALRLSEAAGVGDTESRARREPGQHLPGKAS